MKGEKPKEKKRTKGDKNKNFTGTFSLGVILGIFDIVFSVILIFQYCCFEYIRADLLNYIADSVLVIVLTALTAVCGTVIACIKEIPKEKKKTIIFILIEAVVCLIVGLCNIKIAAIKADYTAEQSEKEKIEEVHVYVDEVYQKVPYVFAENIFVEEPEKYLEKTEHTRSQEEVAEEMAVLIFENIAENNMSGIKRSIPAIFQENIEKADGTYIVYQTYMKQADTYSNENVKEHFEQKAIETLEEAKNYREIAHEKYIDAGNCRHIALYCIDLSDDYNEDVKSAEYCEEAAEWAIKAIYNAGLMNDVVKMKEAKVVLDNAVKRISTMEKIIGEETIDKIKKAHNIYGRVINKFSEIEQVP